MKDRVRFDKNSKIKVDDSVQHMLERTLNEITKKLFSDSSCVKNGV